MKTKRAFLIILTLLLTAVLAVTLTACLKIGMREKNIIERLEEAGASVVYERTSPMTLNGQAGYRIGDIVHATKAYADNGDENETERHIWIFFAQDARSADWIEEECKKYLEQDPDATARWISYRFDEVVMVGYYRLVSIARQY